MNNQIEKLIEILNHPMSYKSDDIVSSVFDHLIDHVDNIGLVYLSDEDKINLIKYIIALTNAFNLELN